MDREEENMNNKQSYLTLKEVAEHLNVSLGYARKLAKNTIGHYRFGCRIYVDKDDLDEWIAAQRNQPQKSLPKRNQPEENPPKENPSQENLPKENLPEENQPEEDLPEENPPQENLPNENLSEENPSQENLPEENQPEPKSGLVALLAPLEDNQQKDKLTIEDLVGPIEPF